MTYLLHASLLICLGGLFYKFILEKETHYRLNRWVLIGTMVGAFILPLWTIPASWSLGSYFYPQPAVVSQPEVQPEPVIASDPAPLFEEPTLPAPEIAPLPTSDSVLPLLARHRTPISPAKFFLGVFLIGSAFLALRFLLQLVGLFRKIHLTPRKKDGKYHLLEVPASETAYSFFNYIFIASRPGDISTYRQILRHEKIHADQKHSLDILLAECLIILQWFNPLAWAYRAYIRQNLEFQTDEIMVKKGTDRTDYQLNLVRIASPAYASSLVANYNQSMLKKRILMMNTQTSSASSAWKYVLLFSLLGLSVSLFNAQTVEHLPQEFPGPVAQSDIQDQADQMDVSIPIETIAPVVTTPPVVQDPAPQTLVSVNEDDFSGTWEATLKSDEVCMKFIRKRNGQKWSWMNHDCLPYRDFSPSNLRNATNFELRREAGTMVFEGEFNGDKGEGTFTFEESADYRRELSRKGVKEISTRLMFTLFFVREKEPFVQNLVDLSKLGLPAATLRDILPDYIPAKLVQSYMDADLDVGKHKHFLHARVPADLLTSYIAAGFDLEKNKSFIHSRVPTDLLSEYRDAGLNPHDHKNLVNSRVPAKLVKAYQDADLDVEENRSFLHSRVPPALLTSYRDAGIDLKENKKFIQSHVPASLLESYEEAGLDLDKHRSFINSRVPASLLEEYQDAGLSLQENRRFIQSRVPADFLASYEKAGLDLEKNRMFINSRVKPEILIAYEEADLDLEKNRRFIQSHVWPKWIKGYQEAGLDPHTHKQFIYSRVKPEMVKAYKKAGFAPEKHKKFIYSHVPVSLLTAYEDAGLSVEEHETFIMRRMDPKEIKAYRDKVKGND